MARDASFELLTLARARRIDLGFEGSHAVVVCGERVLLRELVTNLVHNAIVYTQEGGRVTVIVSLQRGRATVQVIDNGPGIAVAERAKVLERFHRIAGSKESGSGLGLAIVKEICARHSIELALADAPDGPGGLCASLTWPNEQPPPGPRGGEC